MKSTLEDLHLRLAGVTRLSVAGRGPKDAYLFEPHRLALSCWAHAMGARRGAVLVTFDRHYDLVAPQSPGDLPSLDQGLRTVDEHVRWSLDVRNVDHILAAMHLGLVSDVVVFARASPRGSIDAPVFQDQQGRAHRILRPKHFEAFVRDFGTVGASSDARELGSWLSGRELLLDFDLDCFTTLSDADPNTVLPWPRAVIEGYLLPAGSEAFWEAVLARCVALTFARESAHCGGVVAGNALFAEAAEVIFRRLLRADLP